MRGRPISGSYEMLVGERRQHILELVMELGRVLVVELAKSLNVSRITIRKDLDYLQSKGLIERSHGGALKIGSGGQVDLSLHEKLKRNLDEKRRIAAAAVTMVEEDQCIILDSGSTTFAIAEGLKKFRRLTIITNGINIAAELARTDFEVILIGGTLRKNSFSLVGPMAEDNLAALHADILFLGVDGFDIEVGITTPNLLESRVNRAMVKAAHQVVAVFDSTKFNRRSLARIMAPSDVHYVITDRNLPDEAAASLRALDIELTLA
jgi:DeoR family transcriptional regulator, aga operon transcriptional repressor